MPAGKSWFFGIGINAYEHFSNLNNAVKDVKDVITLLQDQYDLGPERVITLFDEEATRDNIIDKLDDLVELVGPEDKLLLYYSGHGSLNKRTNLAYWIPQDAKRRRTSGYIPNSTIRDYIKAINSFHTLLISDSCFSGTLFVRGAARSDEAVEELARRRSRWGLVSGRHDEEVYDGEPGANSPFAAGILNVLRRNRHDKLNVARLADQVVEMTRSNYTQLPEGNPLFGVGHDGGQYVFRLVGSEANIWERCLAENSLAAFNAYLDRFPNGPHADEALQRIKDLEEEKEWERVGRIDKIYAYRSFLRSFPSGKFAADAKTRIRQLQEGEQEERELQLWNRAKAQDTQAAYEKYLATFSAGRYAGEANARIRDLKALEEKAVQEGKAEEAWRQAKQEDTPEAYEAFLRQFPRHRYASPAKERLQSLREEEEAWRLAKQSGKVTALEKFRVRFPNGKYYEEAGVLIRKAKERQPDTPSREDYLKKYWPHLTGALLLVLLAFWGIPKITGGMSGDAVMNQAGLIPFEDKANNLYGYRNEEEKTVIQPRFDYAYVFQEGRAVVEKNDQLGVINPAGELIVDFQYDTIEAFSNGLALVVKDKQYGFIDSSGVVAIPLKYDNAGSFDEKGEAYVELSGKGMTINTEGECIQGCDQDDEDIESSPPAQEEETNRDQNAWEEIRNTNDIRNFQDYLDKFPDGKYRREAQQKIDEINREIQRKEAAQAEDQAWRTAKNANTVTAYDRYLDEYPRGRYASEAKKRKNDLEETARRRAAANAFPKKGSVTLKGENYGIIQYEAGGLTWMTKNLNYELPDSWCYDEKDSNCDQYGRLYTWEAAKRACRELGNGWRLPTDQEWRDLAKLFGGADDDASDDGKAAYKAMIEGGNSGFSARLGGWRYSDGSFIHLGYGGYWSSTERGSDLAWGCTFYRGGGELYQSNYFKSNGHSCRCVQD